MRVQWPHSKAFYLYLTFEFELKQGLSLFIHFLTNGLSSQGLPLCPVLFQRWLCVHGPSFKFNYFMKCHWAKSDCWPGDTLRDCIQVQPGEMSFSHQMPTPSCTVKKIRALTSTFPLTWGSKSQKVAEKRFAPTSLSHRSAHVGCGDPCSVYYCDTPLYLCLPRLFSSTAKLLQGHAVISHCQSNSPLLPEAFSPTETKRFITLIHAPGEHPLELSCLGHGFYQLSNIHLAGSQLCMKGWWRWGSAGRNDLVKLRSIGRRDEWVTNKRTEMGNRAILSSSLLPFRNGKIVTLECTCFATEDLLLLGSKLIFFWDSLV